MGQKIQPSRADIRHRKLFKWIAVPYAWFFNMQYRKYKKWLENSLPDTNPDKTHKIFEIGCGTGAFSAALSDRGLEVTAGDPVPAMLRQALRLNKQRDINFISLPDMPPYDFQDNSFDIVVSAMVLHGLQSTLRQSLMKEAARLSRDQVLFLDYNGHRHFFTDFIEWVEGGDYFHFQATGESEMQKIFSRVVKIPLNQVLCIYLCNK